ncbi:MAG: histidine phosphatase family protein [Thermomicrobiales bacterium]|nr:MAG: histidine phosphatase family protein [Thermomicrobiales bacterium]
MHVKTRLVLVRHGQTSANSSRLLCGSTDLPLDPVGERQAQLVARRIATELDVHALVSSPMARARATAAPIASLTGLSVEEASDLREVCFGDLEGSTVERLETEHPHIAQLMLDPYNTSLRWPNGDHMLEFYTRTQRAFAEIALAHPRETVVVVAHGAVIGGYLRYATGTPINAWRTHGVRNCSISLVDMLDGHPIVTASNDCAHLDTVLELVQEA